MSFRESDDSGDVRNSALGGTPSAATPYDGGRDEVVTSAERATEVAAVVGQVAGADSHGCLAPNLGDRTSSAAQGLLAANISPARADRRAGGGDGMDEQLVEVELGDTEIWPGLSLTFPGSDFFDAAEAIKVPKALLDELQEARRAEYAAERKLAEWLIENGPENVKQMRWILGY